MAPRPLAMGWHPDGVPGPAGTLEARADPKRTPYGPPDLLSTFTYLTDVDETTPAFAVIPKSRRIANIQELKGKKAHLSLLRCHFILNMIILPRQARDKHRKITQKEMICLTVALGDECVLYLYTTTLSVLC